MRFALVALIFVAACAKEEKPITAPMELSVRVDARNLEEATLEWSGRALGKLDGKGNLRVVLHRSDAVRPLDGFSLRVATPCGPEWIPLVRVNGTRERFTERDFDYPPLFSATVWLGEAEPRKHAVGLAYDNRGGGDTKLVVGALQFGVGREARGILPVWHPTCGPVRVVAGERELGVLDPVVPSEDGCGDARPMAIVSLTGPRSYRLQSVEFAWDPWAGGLASARPRPSPPAVTRLDGRAIYVAPSFSWFLTEPPRAVENPAGTTPVCARRVDDSEPRK